MKLDRELQRKVLEACADIYPQRADPMLIIGVCEIEDHAGFSANLVYLTEHGLLDAEIKRYMNNSPPVIGSCVITAKGLDFLANDGGLTAILGTVVVKLHADTIRDMLLAKAEASSLPSPEKSALRQQIEALPATALQTLTTRAAQEGLAHVPDLLHWLRGITGL